MTRGAMKVRPPQPQSFKFALTALSLFSLMQMISKELDLRHGPSLGATASHASPGLYYEETLLSSFLVIASLLLLPEKSWCRAAAAVLGGFVFYTTLPRDFWYLANRAEVERFSREHFSLWWPNLDWEQLVQIISSGLILTLSAASLVSAFVRPRRAKPFYQ